jgi:N-acetylmuramoyl-L-alanine amidase
MSMRCHFDDDGWLQGPIGIAHDMSPNYGSGFAVKARGLVQHTEDGYEAGTFATFMDRGSQVSAFFSVGEDGTAHQYLPVGQGYVAWAEGEGNAYWRSCECEDKTNTKTPMPDAQLTTFAQILEACAAYDGFPLEITDDVNGTGLITHGDGGVSWGDHPDCPGPVRKAQRPQIIALAQAIRDGLDIWTCQGQKSLHDLAADSLASPVHEVLRLTAENSLNHLYAPDMATYLNSVFAADTAAVPAGATLYYPHADGSFADVKSNGDQTLAHLAGTVHCECSAIVRATAEHSAGAVFDDAVASYLDGVFSHSATHIPAGIQLFYRK